MITKEALHQQLDSYVKDPADSPFQRGYLAALLGVDEGEHPSTKILEKQLKNR